MKIINQDYEKNVRTIKPNCQLANGLFYVLLWVEIFHRNAIWTLKLINVQQNILEFQEIIQK